MAKIAFDIKYRPEIEAGKYKVKVGENEARIVCWDYNGDTTLIVLVKDISGERAFLYDTAGNHKALVSDKMPDLELYTDEPETMEDLKKAVESGGALPLWLEIALNKRYVEGYSKGQEEAEKRFRESTSYHISTWPPCFSGGPCTNPHHDCINCPRPGTSGIAKTDTNIK